MSIKKDMLWRVYLSFFVVLLIAVAIIFQGFRIQAFEGERWRSLADSLTTAYKTITAERGNIFSEDGRLLATSMPYFEVRMDVNSTALTKEIFNQHVDSLAICMANYFGGNKAAYKEKLINARKNGERYLLIKRNLIFPQLQVIKTWPLFRLGRYKGGLIIVQENKRKKPFNILAHRTIGYVRTGPGAQSVGLEATYDELLSGINGKRLMQKISGSSWMPVNDKNEIEPKNGSDILTTIDVNMQDVAENALYKSVAKHNAHHGSVIVMEVSTGKIKAIANLGRMEDGSYWEKYNYAIGEGTEPGSTFKVATMMALLEDGLIDLNDSVDLNYGQAFFHGQILKDAEPHNYRNVSVGRAFEISSNAGIAKLAYQRYKKEPQKFIDHLRSFRLDQKMGIEIKGESSPLIKSPGDKGWSAISIPWMAVGYEVLLTPLQTLSFYNAVANKGKFMKPYLVTQIKEYGKTIESFDPVVVDESICSEKTIEDLHQLLIGVVENGTAKNLKNNKYKIAGKTGTSQIANKEGGYGKIYQSSFAGFFPADNPKYSCIVVINKPSNGVYYGSLVAGPVFKEIADKIHASELDMHDKINDDTQKILKAPSSLKGYQHDFIRIFSEMDIAHQPVFDREWISISTQLDSLNLKQMKISSGEVPEVIGMGLKDALYLLENMGLQVEVAGKGKVRKQSRTPGTAYQKGDKIIIELS